ncbi:pyruvate kinase [Sinimarinibacterium sp. CAU 1509]|uniref:pyruvate kinase n=1 Tax=Sinimarinibacterium sp. CAU 1509 TaxID=2562283 RepID=UPI0010AD8EF8|nr:pyruvate kinase [Sinimarinibacterium sp. CAU 1509]TJY59440.1 pyruvate kinase [Sinimarinibacterium sp. CAU 1509]
MFASSADRAAVLNAGPARDDAALSLENLLALRQRVAEFADHAAADLSGISPQYVESARNLLHYIALRQQDLRPLQEQLAQQGLSSLGRAEAHVLATLDAVIRAAQAVLPAGASGASEPVPCAATAHRFEYGERLLQRHAEDLFGVAPEGRRTRIMVTMPSEAADDDALVLNLLRSGMDCMRINCAHDDADAWQRMIRHLRRAESSTQRRCRVLMDLGGPKLRTGSIEPGPAVMRVRPQRDAFGRVIRPARIWLTALDRPQPAPGPADAVLPIAADWLRRLRAGDQIEFDDARDAHRHWRVDDIAAAGCWVTASKSAYLVPGLRLRRSSDGPVAHAEAEIAEDAIARRERPLLLRCGDHLVLHGDDSPGRPARLDGEGNLLEPATLGCTLPGALAAVRAGERVWFDDGRIGGVVEHGDGDRAWVRITQAPPDGGKLSADKGINFPDTALGIPALTDKDFADLEFVARHADMVGLSFVNRADDVIQLHQAIERLGPERPAIVLKIETQTGFAHLPELLLAAMRYDRCGVMIARGDLAVECGFGRLAEVQEELLWLCEAAHVPVIWATQVLESLAKRGMRSRAEVTDAAMGNRAECVMLNKGLHVADAVSALDEILKRMQAHQTKKTPRLRALKLASAFRPARP